MGGITRLPFPSAFFSAIHPRGRRLSPDVAVRACSLWNRLPGYHPFRDGAGIIPGLAVELRQQDVAWRLRRTVVECTFYMERAAYHFHSVLPHRLSMHTSFTLRVQAQIAGLNANPDDQNPGVGLSRRQASCFPPFGPADWSKIDSTVIFTTYLGAGSCGIAFFMFSVTCS